MTPTTPGRGPAAGADRRPDRLPRAALSRGERAGELLRGAAAGAVLLAVLLGLPWALALVVGNPLPTGAPQRGWLDAELSTTALLDVLAVVLWLLWLHFAVCVVAELHAWATGAPAARSGLSTPTRLLARRLVAAVLLVAAGGVPAAAPAAAAVVPAPAATATATATTPGTVPRTADPGWPGGQEAGPARTAPGAPEVPRIPQAPADAVPGAPDPAWGPAPPAAAGPAGAGLVTYVVQPPRGRHHDCLWDIAQRTLGDPLRYREVFELNHDRVQADGSRLVDADLVRPGWELLLPADAVLVAEPGAVPDTPSPPGA
ncbi:LysM peptidoglycan-binding domain-containing protein [Kineococcus sp. LSe6-4]|uniref:LysM peptidoglycan-binding domain-containing protein n=1 Tax=Kineococcus halophytocola TaxID=3234027 RepID=A0ABV4H0P7_9ACTN